MKALLPLLLVGVFLLSGHVRAADPSAKKESAVPPGMRVYFVGLLKKGPKWNAPEEAETAKVLSEHVNYLARLEKDGRVAVAGSFLGANNLRGMVIYKVRAMADARAIVQDDPAVRAGRLLVDLYPWMSADGLRVVTPTAAPRPPAKAPPKKSPPPPDKTEKTVEKKAN